MAILGRSGAGKTNVTFHILAQLIERKIPFIFLDWKRTVRHLIPNFKNKLNIYTPGRALSKFPFNPFVVPPGIESNVYVNQVVDVMSQAFTLGDGSRSVLRKAIATLYTQNNLCPTANDIISEVEKAPGTGRMGGWKITAMRALQSLEYSDISSKDQISQEQLTTKLLHENTVIELDALAQESKKFLVPLLCLWLYYVRLNSPDREKLKLVIFLEEAHHYLHKRAQTANETVLEMLFRQCREMGIGIVVVDQHPHLLSAAAMGNSYTTICLNQKDPSDINKAAAVSLLDTDEKNYFSMLPVGQAIIKLQDRWPRPFLVKFPLMNVKKGSVTDDILARYSAINLAKRAGSGRKTSVLPESQQVPRIPLYDIPLQQPAFAFIEDVLQHPDDGVKTRYKRLGLSTGTANRLKQQLLDQNWLEDQTIEIGKTRTVILRLTKQSKAALNLDTSPPQHDSIAHEYWKRFYAQRFREQGHTVQFEAPRNSGNVDVLVTKDNKTTAIEIETGKSDIIRNVKQDLLSGFDKVLIVATDKKALGKVEQQLAQEGLYIPSRVQVTLRNA
jgi:Helicase HerA, central domain